MSAPSRLRRSRRLAGNVANESPLSSAPTSTTIDTTTQGGLHQHSRDRVPSLAPPSIATAPPAPLQSHPPPPRSQFTFTVAEPPIPSPGFHPITASDGPLQSPQLASARQPTSPTLPPPEHAAGMDVEMEDALPPAPNTNPTRPRDTAVTPAAPFAAEAISTAPSVQRSGVDSTAGGPQNPAAAAFLALQNNMSPPKVSDKLEVDETSSSDSDDAPHQECTICCKDLPEDQMRQPCTYCNCWYCIKCIRDMFERAVEKDRFTPAQCHMIIQLHVGLPLLSKEQAQLYRDRFEEYLAIEKVYCPVKTCSKFIPERIRHTDQAPPLTLNALILPELPIILRHILHDSKLTCLTRTAQNEEMRAATSSNQSTRNLASPHQSTQEPAVYSYTNGTAPLSDERSRTAVPAQAPGPSGRARVRPTSDETPAGPPNPASGAESSAVTTSTPAQTSNRQVATPTMIVTSWEGPQNLDDMKHVKYVSVESFISDLRSIVNHAKLPDRFDRTKLLGHIQRIVMDHIARIKVSTTTPNVPQKQPGIFPCTGCYIAICSRCRQVAHPGKPCDFSEMDYEIAFMLQYNYKQCPICKTATKRMFGCNHMQCQCGAHWCWRCQKPIDACAGQCGDDAESDVDDDEGDEMDEGSDDEEAEDDYVPELSLSPAESNLLHVHLPEHVDGLVPSQRTARRNMTRSDALESLRLETRNMIVTASTLRQDILDFSREQRDAAAAVPAAGERHGDPIIERVRSIMIDHMALNLAIPAMQEEIYVLDALVATGQGASEQMQGSISVVHPTANVPDDTSAAATTVDPGMGRNGTAQQAGAQIHRQADATDNSTSNGTPFDTRPANRPPRDLDAGGADRWAHGDDDFGEEPVEPMSSVWTCVHEFHRVIPRGFDKTVQLGTVVECNRCFKEMEVRGIQPRPHLIPARPSGVLIAGDPIAALYADRHDRPANRNGQTGSSSVKSNRADTLGDKHSYKEEKKADRPHHCQNCNVLYCGECRDIVLARRKANRRW